MFCWAMLLAFAIGLLAAESAGAGESAELDWSTWQRMPVFDDGRLMPLDSFARAVVKEICGTPRPTLVPARIPPGSAAAELFPGGNARQFEAAELLFSWMVEPEKWEQIPVLIADNAQLQAGLLGLSDDPTTGRRARHVAPRDLVRAPALWDRLDSLRQQQMTQTQGNELKFEGVDAEVVRLWDAYTLYRLVTFDASSAIEGQGRFIEKLAAAVRAWRGLEPELRGWLQPLGRPDGDSSIEAFSQSVDALIELIERDRPTVADADSLLTAMHRSAARLAAETEALRREAFRAEAADPLDRAAINALAVETAALAQLADETRLALFDNGRALRLVPALCPAALRAERDLGDDNQPWLNLQTLLMGSDSLLEAYPRQELAEFRAAFAQATTVYLDRAAPERPERFVAAMERVARATRALGEAIEPLRRELPIPGDPRDATAMLVATAYPPPGATDVEWRYNRLNPFLWTWPVCLLATVCLALSLWVGRRVLFWAGMVVLALGLTLIVFGLGLRTVITAWVSVTNMFEVIMFVGLSAGVLGLWFTLLPLLRPGLGAAWRMAALPGPLCCGLGGRNQSVDGSPGDHDGATPGGNGSAAGVRWLLLVPRVVLMVGVFATLAVLPYGSAGRTVIALLPRRGLGASPTTVNDLLVWAAGWCVLVLAVWWVPRLIVAAAVSLVSVPLGARRAGVGRLLEEVDRQRLCVLVGAVMATLATVVGYYVPVFDKDIRPLMPILRDNFWLTVHVSSITASYGAAALAWGLGNVALGFYLFGNYRTVRQSEAAELGPPVRQPPQACAVLGQAIYRAIQLAVLMLAVGTVLGGLWGDVAWGRFWAWDPKEVWALICLLVFLAVLHARRGGHAGDFGLAMAGILGATAIVMAWYGVNFLLKSGLHSYADGSGGLLYVGSLATFEWAFVGLAGFRQWLETGPRSPRPATREGNPA